MRCNRYIFKYEKYEEVFIFMIIVSFPSRKKMHYVVLDDEKAFVALLINKASSSKNYLMPIGYA